MQIRIQNNPPAPIVPDTIVSASTGIQMGSFEPTINRINAADENGDFHSHVYFFLEPNLAPDPVPAELFGAYGLKMSLSTDAESIVDSDPFFLVFNLGLDEESFEESVAAYAAIVPEPAGIWLIIGGGGCLFGAFDPRKAKRRALRNKSDQRVERDQDQ